MSATRAPARPSPVNAAGWRPWGELAALFALSAGFVAYAIVPASILPLLAGAFEIEKTTASASISAIFLTWALLQIPAGLVMDRRDNRRLVTAAAVVFVLSAVAGVLADTYPSFLLTRLLSGACVVFVFVGSINVLAHDLPEDRRALGMSLYIASPPVGIALAQATGPLVVTPYGWRTAILAYVALAVLGLLGFVVLGGDPVTTAERATVRQFARTLLDRDVLLVSLASLCTYTIWTFLVTWMPSFGTDVLGFDLAAAGATASLVPIAGIVARPGGAWISDRIDGRLRPVIATSFLASMALLYALNGAPSPTVFAVLLALAGAAVNLSVGLYLVYVRALSADATQGTSLSVLLTFSQVGNLVAPVLGGWLIAEYTWAGGFGFAIVVALVGLVAIARTPKLA